MAHGEILLMVDVPETRVADIEGRVHRHHPEVAVGGIGWGRQRLACNRLIYINKYGTPANTGSAGGDGFSG